MELIYLYFSLVKIDKFFFVVNFYGFFLFSLKVFGLSEFLICVKVKEKIKENKFGLFCYN